MGKCADIVLTSGVDVLVDAPDVPLPLPMLQTTCDYSLMMNGFLLTTLRSHRQLQVTGSVANGTLIVSIQTGTDTPRLFEFANTPSFTLAEDLLKGDKIAFSYIGTGTTISIKAKIVKK